MNYWLIKSEPFKYSWDTFCNDKTTMWDGVRNYAARNNLRSMKKGDLAFFYHSNEGMNIVGIAEVVKESYQDPTIDNPAWLVVDFRAKQALKKTVSLVDLKTDGRFENMDLLRLGRLSVGIVTSFEFDEILKLSNTKLKK